VSVRELRLRVALKLLTAFALVCILIFSLRYVFNVQSQPRGGSQRIDVATLELYQAKSFTRVGKELLLVRKGQDSFLLVNQRSPEFSCLLEMSIEQSEALIKLVRAIYLIWMVRSCQISAPKEIYPLCRIAGSRLLPYWSKISKP